ncbi:MAG: hypothetical protein SPL05_06130 [Eubacteriales bacterium]|nr:hypothetical protein [Eubacteriales bacterium]
MKKLLAFALLCVCLCFGTMFAHAQEQTVVEHKGDIYQVYLQALQKYNIETQQWEDIMPLPVEEYARNQLIDVNGKLYLAIHDNYTDYKIFEIHLQDKKTVPAFPFMREINEAFIEQIAIGPKNIYVFTRQYLETGSKSVLHRYSHDGVETGSIRVAEEDLATFGIYQDDVYIATVSNGIQIWKDDALISYSRTEMPKQLVNCIYNSADDHFYLYDATYIYKYEKDHTLKKIAVHNEGELGNAMIICNNQIWMANSATEKGKIEMFPYALDGKVEETGLIHVQGAFKASDLNRFNHSNTEKLLAVFAEPDSNADVQIYESSQNVFKNQSAADLLDLSKSEKLQSYYKKLYPFIAEKAKVNDKYLLLPYNIFNYDYDSISIFNLGIYAEHAKHLQIPTQYASYKEFIDTMLKVLQENPNLQGIDVYSYQRIKASIKQLAALQYKSLTTEQQQYIADLYAGLDAMLKLDYNRESYPNLITIQYDLLERTNGYVPLNLKLDKNGKYSQAAYLDLICINKNAPQAIAFVEYLVEQQNISNQAKLFQDFSVPKNMPYDPRLSKLKEYQDHVNEIKIIDYAYLQQDTGMQDNG